MNVRLILVSLCLGLSACAVSASPSNSGAVIPGLPAGYTPSTDDEAVGYERAKIHTELGAQYFGAGQIGVALDEFNTALAAEQRYVPAHYMLGLVYMELKEDARAEQYFKSALDLDSNNSEAHNNYGWFLCQRNHIDESIKQFMAALKNPLYETPDKPYLNAGICSIKRHDDKSAEEYFLKALKLSPDQPQALLALAEVYYRANDLPNARAQMLTFNRVQNPTAESLWLGVRIEHKLNSDKNAEASYAQMLRQRYPLSKEAQALAASRYE
jgi:type IV pilus assembly protein PilF